MFYLKNMDAMFAVAAGITSNSARGEPFLDMQVSVRGNGQAILIRSGTQALD